MSNTPEQPGAPFERAEAMQLDACLQELGGVGPAADLVHRILKAATSRSPQAAAQRRSRWLVAALMFAGIGVVAAVAYLQRDQQPQPAVAPQGPDKPQGKEKPAPKPEDLVTSSSGSTHLAAIIRAISDLDDAGKHDAALATLKRYPLESLPLLRPDSASPSLRPSQLLLWREAFDEVARDAKVFAFAEPVTLIADYSDNRVRFVNAKGEVLWNRDDVFGAWDAEVTPQKTLLLTEFSISRVEELDREGNVLWFFDSLKNPYDADRLPNGNTLIADTFGNRVIEVNPQNQIVWKYDTEIRPFDCDRLANGNTLIADVLKDRVIEVSPEGEIVWEVKNMNNVRDADRLPNGNTLITLRAADKVVEVDKERKVVWELQGLRSPSDADRLPNGNTLVAENTQVREFDPAGKVVWKYNTTWAVEVNRY